MQVFIKGDHRVRDQVKLNSLIGSIQQQRSTISIASDCPPARVCNLVEQLKILFPYWLNANENRTIEQIENVLREGTMKINNLDQ